MIEGDTLKSFSISGEEEWAGDTPTAHALQVASGGTRSATEQAGTGEGGEWAWGDAHRAQLRDFAQACRGDRRPRVDGETGMEAVRLIAALYESARNGREVRLDG